LFVAAEAVEVPEMGASQVLAGGTSIEEADQYFSLSGPPEFSEADITAFE
jgi:hypothetical protein